MAVRNDWPEFIPILQKALDTISETERDEIYNRWIRVKYEEEIDYRLILLVIGVAIIVVSLFYTWNRRLKREVGRRQEAEIIKQQALDQAENANRAKSDFLAAMSHDLRTPLNSILGFVQLLEQQAFGPIDNEKYREYHQIIQTSAEHLLGLVEEILDLSRLEAEKFKLNIERYDPVAHTSDVIKTFEPIVSEKNVSIDLSSSENMPSTIWADRKIATQIQNNLISNAVREAPPGSAVKVKWSKIDEDRFTLEVRDYGRGYSDNVLSSFGQPFFVSQPEHSSDQKKGYGLGLYICKRYVESRGGKLTLSNPPGGGAQVVADWPANVLSAPDSVIEAAAESG